MLPVETELHLQLKLAGERLCFNDLADWGRRAGLEVGRQLLSEILWRIQIQHASRVVQGGAEVGCPRCGVIHRGSGVVRRGSRLRKVRTSGGLVVFRLVQLTCKECGGTWSPYPELLGLEPRCRVSEELLRQLFEGVLHLSYGKSCELAQYWIGSSVSSRTLHRAVQEKAGQVCFTEAPGLKTVVADGSLVKAGEKKRGEEYCVSFQVQGRGKAHGRPAVMKRVVGFGFGQRGWYDAFNTSTRPKLVVTDGEQGIRECVARCYPRARHQLCEWHIPYTLNLLMLMDGRRRIGSIPLARRKQLLDNLRDIIRRRDHEGYTRFTGRLKQYSHARAYLENAQPYIMYARRSVRTTSWAERQMRELNRRTDVGVRWSLTGVANMLKLRLAKSHNQDDYERIWTAPNPLAYELVPQS